MKKELKILIYGFGNPGRKDDGLGYEFVRHFSDWIENEGIKNIEFDCNYQLNIEDAHLISEKDIVLFVDASTENIDNFILSKVDDDSDMSFTTHEASPGYIFHLCKKLFNKSPDTYLLHIKGYEWNFQEGISELATNNLDKSLNFTKSIFKNNNDIKFNFITALN